jgi:2-methylcitrate dehydratase PrpD
LLDGLGANPLITVTYFKPYSCCRYNHAALDAFTALKSSHRLTPDDIVAVDVHIFGWALKLGNKTEPGNLVDVQYSIPYCIGMAAVMGGEALLPIEADALSRPDVSAFARKVTLHTDPAMDARFPHETPARVVITTRNAIFESPVTTPRGEPSNPLSWEDLREKFRVATRKVMREEQQKMTLEAVDQLAQGELDPLWRILASSIEK